MDKKIVRMEAGLANRMFQYAYGLYLKKRGYDVYYDNSNKHLKWATEDIDWNRIFPKAVVKQACQWELLWYGVGFDIVSKVRYNYFPWSCNLARMKNAFCLPTEEEIKSRKCFFGVFQNCSFLEGIRDEVCDIFTFPPFERSTTNDKLCQRMRNENSVAIHFRKGKDYMQIINFKDTCPVEYYRKAVTYIKLHVESPVFYVFTDNAEWVKENINDLDFTLVQENPAIGWGNHFDMQLMSCCKHNIIANSTFSWWGAYLNKNPHKIVIGPKNWFNPEMDKYKGFENTTLCKDWIKM